MLCVLVCMHVYLMCALCLRRLEVAVTSIGTGNTAGCELSSSVLGNRPEPSIGAASALNSELSLQPDLMYLL